MPPNDINPESNDLLIEQDLNTKDDENENDENKDIITKQPEKTKETFENDVKIDEKPQDCDCLTCVVCCHQIVDCWFPMTWLLNCCCDNQCCMECANSTCDGCVECLSGCGDCFVNCAQCCEP